MLHLSYEALCSLTLPCCPLIYRLDLMRYITLDEKKLKWDQTFTINATDYRQLKQTLYECTLAGNLVLHHNDTLPVVLSFLEEINKKHQQ